MENQKTVSLFSIATDRINLDVIIEEMEGELTPEMEKALELNVKELASKGESYVFILEKLHSYIEFNKRYKEQADKNIKRSENAMKRLKENLLDAVKIHGDFDAGIHKISSRKSKRLEILDTNLLPKKYQDTKVVQTWNKKAITDDIKAGKKVKGAELTENLNLAIK